MVQKVGGLIKKRKEGQGPLGKTALPSSSSPVLENRGAGRARRRRPDRRLRAWAWPRGEGKRKEGKSGHAPAAIAGYAGQRAACAVGCAPGRRGRKRRERKREGEIRGGRTRRVALDGKWMGRALKSDIGSFRRNPGTRVQGLRGSRARRRKTTLAHDLF